MAQEKNDSANVDYIRLNCKPCPKCKTNIEKNQGCQHMTCRKCMHEFCWICKETWFHHTSAVHANCGQGKGQGGKVD